MNKQKTFDQVTTYSVLILIGSAFYMASRSFWGVNMLQFELAVLATLSFGACAWLLSSVLPTIIELCKNKYLMSAGVTAALGVFLLTLEITLTKTGFGWLKSQSVAGHVSFDDGVLTMISVGLSMFNIFAKWSFIGAIGVVRDIKAAKEAAAGRAERRQARIEKQIQREKAGLVTKRSVAL